ncbi:carbon-nitrogen family hydrolase [Oceanobacillus jeddahense]|uniref:Carbon-nitrogen family hydrolase n=1 Tax=Oceanobacillus jeddahense TaxID=1462527 RepID=A0ABY5JQZ9_9BACI|nr:carbon-nitrogen family hydrolase [Oceanobacillus jeddahense]UUI02750.1 carbon-nitrogen family hydrolase [Oceanobacillus jeddahense]
MKHAIYQMDIIPGDPENNRKRVKEWLEKQVKEEKPDIVVLPEMWTTAYTLDQLDHIADLDGEPTRSFLKELAKTHQVHIIGGSFANKAGDGIYNTALVVNNKGEEIYTYDKIHLVPMLNEPKYLTGGEKHAHVFELDGIKMGLLICYDLRFPELARELALAGAEVIYIVAEWPSARKDHWKALQLARAIENQCYVVSSNRIGSYDGVKFCGASLVVDPWGTIIKEGSEEQEETLIEAVDISNVERIRKEVPVFKSRVPEMYQGWK